MKPDKGLGTKPKNPPLSSASDKTIKPNCATPYVDSQESSDQFDPLGYSETESFNSGNTLLEHESGMDGLENDYIREGLSMGLTVKELAETTTERVYDLSVYGDKLSASHIVSAINYILAEANDYVKTSVKMFKINGMNLIGVLATDESQSATATAKPQNLQEPIKKVGFTPSVAPVRSVKSAQPYPSIVKTTFKNEPTETPKVKTLTEKENPKPKKIPAPAKGVPAVSVSIPRYKGGAPLIVYLYDFRLLITFANEQGIFQNLYFFSRFFTDGVK